MEQVVIDAIYKIVYWIKWKFEGWTTSSYCQFMFYFDVFYSLQDDTECLCET